MRAAIVISALLLAGCADPGLLPDGGAEHGQDGHHDGHAEHGEAGHAAPSQHSAAGHAGGGHAGPAGAWGHGAHAVHDYDPHTDPHAGDHGQPGMQRPTFAPAIGAVPTAEQAAALPQVSMLRLIGDKDLDSSGRVAGSGSLADPYIIEGLYVAGDLMLQDTDACVVIRENYIGGQLTLNWNGQCVHVHHNHIYDLRVNENIRRIGYATGGLLERNLIEFVGQLRHYDGEFRFNTVGPMPSQGPFDVVRETTPILDAGVLIANIDGFNQGLIHNNTFHGSVDLDFHGHHHGTGFFAPHSHYHGDDPKNYTLHDHDHRERWTSVAFVDNRIIDEKGYGLRYDDRNHAGDDRVANSEQEEQLDEEHFHRSHILIARNTVEGAGIWIDVFNADDSHHEERNDGWLDVVDNTVHLKQREGNLLVATRWDPTVGFDVDLAKEVELVMRGNLATYEAREQGLLDLMAPPATSAYDVTTLKDALLVFEDNRAHGFDTGLKASRFEDVRFLFTGNDFGDAEQPTQFDDTVPEP